MTDNFQWGKSIPEPDINETGEFFASLADHLHAALVSQGIDAQHATTAIDATLVHLAKTFSGEKIYIGKQPAIFAKWMQAYNDLRTMHYRDVDRKYGWSPGYSLKVKEKIIALMQRRTQLRLPIE